MIPKLTEHELGFIQSCLDCLIYDERDNLTKDEDEYNNKLRELINKINKIRGLK